MRAVVALVAVFLPPAGFAVDAASLAAAVREAKVREAALRSIEGSIDVLRERLADATTLAETMLAEPSKYADPDDAIRTLKVQEQGKLLSEFESQLQAFARGRTEQLPNGWVGQVITEEQDRVAKTINTLLDQDFEGRFREARAAAVEQQRETVRPQLAPPADEVERLLGDLDVLASARREQVGALAESEAWRAWQEARLSAVRRDVVTFREIDREMPSALRRNSRDAVEGLWRQLRMLERYETAGVVRREEIENALRDDLTTLTRSTGLPQGLFPAAEQRLQSRSEELERTSLLEFIGGQLSRKSECPALPATTVEAAAGSAAAEMPSNFDEHAKDLGKQLRTPTEKGLIRQYAALAPEGEARDSFAARLTSIFGNDEAIGRRLAAGFEACLTSPLREHRERLAREELTARQPTISDLSFELSDDDLVGLVANGDEVDPTVFPAADGLHLEETRALHAAQVAELQREALDVIRAQELLTRARSRRREFVQSIKDDAQQGSNRKEHFQNQYEKSVEKAWQKRRARVLLRDENGKVLHESKYGRVLPTTSQIIDEIITLEFERPAPTATKPKPTRTQIPSRPPTPPPTQTPPPTRTQKPRTPQPRISGPLDRAERSGLPQPRPEPIPKENSGGAPAKGPLKKPGGAKDCGKAVRNCRQASEICYAALLECRDDPASCQASLARCGQLKFECEQAK